MDRSFNDLILNTRKKKTISNVLMGEISNMV